MVEELGDEIDKMLQAKPSQDKIRELMRKKVPLERELVDIVSKEIETNQKTPEQTLKLQDDISKIDMEISPLIKKTQTVFNPHWGEVMRAGNEESYFAHQVDRFADIYMPTLSDLLAISPRTYFRSQRRPLAHEMALSLMIEDL